jgi:hypothetical protein
MKTILKFSNKILIALTAVVILFSSQNALALSIQESQPLSDCQITELQTQLNKYDGRFDSVKTNQSSSILVASGATCPRGSTCNGNCDRKGPIKKVNEKEKQEMEATCRSEGKSLCLVYLNAISCQAYCCAN